MPLQHSNTTMTKLEREQQQDEILRKFLDQPEPPESPKAVFERVLRSYYRRAGPDAATALLGSMQDASDDGAYQQELLKMAQKALSNLPTVH